MRGLTIKVPAPHVELTTLANVKADLGATGGEDDVLLTTAIRDASAAVSRFCGRTFVRQDYSELGPAFGSVEFQCREAPVVKLISIACDGGVLLDVTVGDADQGVLYRRAGFDWSAQRWGGLAGGGDRFMDFGTPIVGQEEPTWGVVYRAGFIPPGHDVTSSGITVSTDNAFLSAGALFPANLAAGDVIEVSGFNLAANVGRFVIAGTPTASKVVVSSDSALVSPDTDTSTGVRTIRVMFTNLPADVEKAAREAAKFYYGERKEAGSPSSIVQKQLGIASVRYGEVSRTGGVDAAEGALPPLSVSLLRRWVRGI